MLARSLISLAGGVGPRLMTYSTQSTSGSSVAVDKPLGTTSGDFLVAILSGGSASGVSWTGPAGWAERLDQGVSPSLAVFSKTAGGGEASSYTFTASATVFPAGIILRFNGGQWDVVGAVGTSTGEASTVMPSISSSGGMLLACIAAAESSAQFSTPTGMAEVLYFDYRFAGGMAVFRENVEAGATGSRTSTVSDNFVPTTNAGVLISVAPL